MNQVAQVNVYARTNKQPGAPVLKDVPGGFPKSDLLGVTVALIHVAGQQFLAVISHLWQKIAQTPWHILKEGG